MTKMEITHEIVKSLLSYDKETGIFTWLEGEERFLRSKYAFTIHKNKRAGRVAGSVGSNGYLVICINGENYLAHRLAVMWVEGRWPYEQVDHINGNRADNRWGNLREVSQAENKKNMGKRREPNKQSGYTGIYLAPRYTDRWTIRVGSKTVGYAGL